MKSKIIMFFLAVVCTVFAAIGCYQPEKPENQVVPVYYGPVAPRPALPDTQVQAAPAPLVYAYPGDSYSLPRVERQPTPLMYYNAPSYTAEQANGGLGEFLRQNWLALLLGFLAFVEVIVRLTPTETDNSIFNILKRLLDAWFPNVNKQGEKYV